MLKDCAGQFFLFSLLSVLVYMNVGQYTLRRFGQSVYWAQAADDVPRSAAQLQSR